MVASVETYDVTNVSSSANITLDTPSGTVDGTVLIAAIVCTVGATWTDPDDFDIIASSSQAVLLRRVCDGTEDATYTFTNNQALGNQRGILFRIDGANRTTPIVDPKIKTTGASLNPTSDSVTATEADSLLVCGLNLITSTTTITVPSGMAEEINDATGQRKAVASLGVGSGATGAKTWTLGASTASATYSFIVNPAVNYDGTASRTETVTLTADGTKGVSDGGSVAETVTLSAGGATGTASDANDLAASVTLEAAGLAGFGGDGLRDTTVTLTAAGAAGSTADRASVVTLAADGQVGQGAGAALAASASLVASGSAGYTKSADSLAVTITHEASGLTRRWFNPPTQDQSMDDPFWGRYSMPVGVSVVKIDGHYINVPTPTNDELIAAGVEGVDFFRGGYVYEISAEVEAALIADGYGPGISPVGFGHGPFGHGPFGGS